MLLTARVVRIGESAGSISWVHRSYDYVSIIIFKHTVMFKLSWEPVLLPGWGFHMLRELLIRSHRSSWGNARINRVLSELCTTSTLTLREGWIYHTKVCMSVVDRVHKSPCRNWSSMLLLSATPPWFNISDRFKSSAASCVKLFLLVIIAILL